jgi:DnaJ-class molecular chaperone
MADAGTIDVSVKVAGYWQTCPVCVGRGTVPPDFYECFGYGTSTARGRCRRCVGTGTIAVPWTTQETP